tara:strand:+ start:258 stop:467 length:210 start_codon:yes stop_codon:yes gene_type:complete
VLSCFILGQIEWQEFSGAVFELENAVKATLHQLVSVSDVPDKNVSCCCYYDDDGDWCSRYYTGATVRFG